MGMNSDLLRDFINLQYVYKHNKHCSVIGGFQVFLKAAESTRGASRKM